MEKTKGKLVRDELGEIRFTPDPSGQWYMYDSIQTKPTRWQRLKSWLKRRTPGN